MSDERVIEHPNAALRRRVTELEERIERLERNQTQRAQVDMTLFQKYEIVRCQVADILRFLGRMGPM